MIGISVLGAIVAAIIGLIYYTEKVEFAVPKHGIILVTGASTGIGRHAVEHLALKSKNFTVLAGVRKEKDARSISEMQIKNLVPIILDVAQHESCVAAVEAIKSMMSETGQPFVGLVNNAGIAMNMLTELHDMENARRIFDVNFFGALDMTQLTLPLLRESKGRIVQISSLAGFVANIGFGVYSASKFALEGVSDAMRRELQPLGVSVSIIEPGFVKTPILDTAAKSAQSMAEALEDKYAAAKKAYPAEFLSDATLNAGMNKAPGPEVVSAVVDDALFSSFPKTRYQVAVADENGTPGSAVRWVVWLLTDRIMDLMAIKNTMDHGV